MYPARKVYFHCSERRPLLPAAVRMSQPHQVRVEAPALERYLEGGYDAERPIRILPRDLPARLKVAFRDPDEEFAELLPERILVAWRIIRPLAFALGLCAEDESLDAATDREPSPWTTPRVPDLSVRDQLAVRRSTIARVLQFGSTGLPLLPPPAGDPLLAKWCCAAAFMARDVGVERSARGRAGLEPFLDPAIAPFCGVTPEHLLGLERVIVDETTRIVVESGDAAAVRYYRERYCFSRGEAMALVRLARSEALRAAPQSIEEARAITVARLEDFLGRAKETMNMADELRALKELARVQGLTRSEPEDRAGDFLRVIAEVASRQDAQRLESSRVLDALPAASIEDAVFEELPRQRELPRYKEATRE